MFAADVSSFHQSAQAASLSPLDLQTPQQVVALQIRISARLDSLQARVEQFSRFCGDLALFWSPAADGLRVSLQNGTNDHIRRVRALRTELGRTCQDMDGLPGGALPAMLERLSMLDSTADDLLEVLERWEQFWKAEAEWRPDAVIKDGDEGWA